MHRACPVTSPAATPADSLGEASLGQPLQARPSVRHAPHRRPRAAQVPELPRAPEPAPVNDFNQSPSLPDIPGVWRADACAPSTGAWSTGHAALDAQLPGGGWPSGGLVELLSAQPGLYEGSLLAPYWASVTRAQPTGRLAWVMLGHSPWRLHAPGVLRLGLQPEQLWCLQPATEADAAWAVEQMLRSGAVAGIWWLTRHAQPQQLRRLQWAAQSRGIPLFASRPLACRQDPSAAPLRLHLQAGPEQSLRVHILKRQGPRHEQALHLPCTAPLHLLPRPALPRPAQPHVVDRALPAPVAA